MRSWEFKGETNVCRLQMKHKPNPVENLVLQFSVFDLHSIKSALQEIYLKEVYFVTQTFSVTTRIQKGIERLGTYL